MADKIVTVKPAGQGGTYTSLAAAIAGEVAANPDLVTMDGILTISIDGDWSSVTDTAIVSIDGFTVDASHYVKVVAAQSNRAGKTWDISKYKLSTSYAGAVLQLRSNYTRVIGLQIYNTRTNGGITAFLRGDGCLIDSCFCRGGFTSSIQMAHYVGGRQYAINCIVAESVGIGIKADENNRERYIYNCIVSNCGGVGIALNNSSTQVLKNCYSGGNVGTDYTGANATLVNCRSEDGSLSTPTAPYTTATFTSVTDGAEDFSLPAGSSLIGQGVDLSADSVYPFNYDITGATRTVPWDIGAYKYVGSGPTPIEGTASGTQSSQTGSAQGGIEYAGQSSGTQASQSGTAQSSITYLATSSGAQSVQTGQAQGSVGSGGIGQGTQTAQYGQGQGSIAYISQASGEQARQTGQAQAAILYAGISQGTQLRQTGKAYSSEPTREILLGISDIIMTLKENSDIESSGIYSSNMQSIKSDTSAIVTVQRAVSEVL